GRLAWLGHRNEGVPRRPGERRDTFPRSPHGDGDHARIRANHRSLWRRRNVLAIPEGGLAIEGDLPVAHRLAGLGARVLGRHRPGVRETPPPLPAGHRTLRLPAPLPFREASVEGVARKRLGTSAGGGRPGEDVEPAMLTRTPDRRADLRRVRDDGSGEG